MGVRVSVSARVLNWPQQCACCLGSPNQSYCATFARVTGQRVVRVDERGWDVPYCDDCLGHAEEDARAKAANAGPANLVLGLGGGCGTMLALSSMVCILPAVFGAPNTVQNRLAVILTSITMLAIGAGLTVGGVLWFRNLHASATQQRRRATKRARSLVSARCCGLSIAVVYEGWSGSVHTFWFANPDFADAFVRANAGKVLRS